MGQTSIATGNALTKKVWEEKLYRDVLKEEYWAKFKGESSSSLVQTKTQLTKSKGDVVNVGIRMRLSGAGVTEGQLLEGNEEALTTYQDDITLARYRHAVRDDGAMTRQRAVFDVSQESRDAIKDWMIEKRDGLLFDAAFGSYSRIAYREASAGAFTIGTVEATVKSAISSAANGIITPDFISKLGTYAETGGNRTFVPLKPVKIKGKNHYVLLVHNDVVCDLWVNSDFKQSIREAEVRSSEHPLFAGAAAIMWNGIIVHAHERVPIGTNAGAGAIAYSEGILLGQQALLWAEGGKDGNRPGIIEKTFDYEDQKGYAMELIAAASKPVFNSEVYGSIGVYLTRTKTSDA